MRNRRQGRPAGKKKGAHQHQQQPRKKNAAAAKKRPREEEEDEEIDEDTAFNEEDEKKYGELLREIEEHDERKRKRGDEDEEEEEEDEEDDDGAEGGMLLSDLLGAPPSSSSPSGKPAKPAAGKKQQKAGKAAAPAAEEEDDDEEEDEEMEEDDDEEDDDEEGDDDEDEEEEMEGAEEHHAGLMQMVERLAHASAKPRRGGAAEDDDEEEAGRALQNMPDSAFGTSAAQGLTLEAMLDSLQDTRGFAAVRKQLSGLSKGSAVAAPAPKVVQERAERQVVYGERTKAVADWLPLVAAARQADTLNFSYQPRQVSSQAELVGKFEPDTEMERAIRDLLTHAKADKEAKVEEGEAEALAAKGLTLEQVKSRQAELARMRALLFYEQQKRHRINKIKSKAYHRIRKKQKQRKDEKEHEALREVDPEAAAALDEKAARARVEERMSLRHKNTSKWAKHVMAHGAAHQADTRKALAEQLQMGEDLRKRAAGGGSSDESDDESESDDEEVDEEERERRERRRAAQQVRGVLGDVVNGEEDGEAKGLLGMKFMRRAVERQRERAREEVEAVLRELEQRDDDDEDEEEEEGGAAVSGPSPVDQSLPPASNVAMATGGAGIRTTAVAWGGQGSGVTVSGPITVTTSSSTALAAEVRQEEEEESEEGSAAVSSSAARVASSGVLASFRATAPSSAGKKQQQQQPKAPVAGPATTNGTSSSNPWMEAAVSRPEGRQVVVSKRGRKAGGARAMLSTEEAVADMQWDEEDGEDGEEEQGGDGGRVVIARTAEQQALVQRAFAAPDVEADFAEDKAEQVREEREEEEKRKGKKKGGLGGNKPTVPGWGCWAGMGAPAPTSQAPLPTKGGKGSGGHRQQQQQGPGGALVGQDAGSKAVETGDVSAPRVDDKLPTVLINERRSKQAAKYKVAEVPYPFTSREQYERLLRLPVGKEWNTTLTVREATRAPVIVKPGTIVQPIKLRKKHRAIFPGSS